MTRYNSVENVSNLPVKNNFNIKFGGLLAEKKKAFLDDGGNEIDFRYNNPIKSQYNDLLFEYKVKRDRYYKQQEETQKEIFHNSLSECVSDLNLFKMLAASARGKPPRLRRRRKAAQTL